MNKKTEKSREKYDVTKKWSDTFKRVRFPFLNNIHDGGHVRSRNLKWGWVLYWHEIILNELGQGGSRDRLRSLCVPSSRQILIKPSFFVWPFCCLQSSTIQPRFRSSDPPWPSSLRIRPHLNREPNLAFSLVTHRDYLIEWFVDTMNLVLTLFDPLVEVR